MEQVTLVHQASAGETNKQVCTELPFEVVQCLENARFAHFATCTNNQPHVSLMNYTYLPSSPYSSSPVIVMTTNPASKKMNNLVANPNVSLLVHDWVYHRPQTTVRRASGSPPRPEYPISPLASLLQNMNSEAVSSISAAISGSASLVPRGSAQESYYRTQHLENNTFAADEGVGRGSVGGGMDMFASLMGGGQQSRELGDGEAGAEGLEGRFVAGEEVRVVVVGIRDVRVSDWKGNVRDLVLVPEGNGTSAPESAPLVVNGV